MHTPPSITHRKLRVVQVVTLLLLLSLAGCSNVVSFRPPAQPGAAAPAPAAGQRVAPGDVPSGLGAAEWARLQAQLAAPAYRPAAAARGYQAANPAQGWQIAYAADGTTTLTPATLAAPAWRWGLRLLGFGEEPLTLTTTGAQLRYQRRSAPHALLCSQVLQPAAAGGAGVWRVYDSALRAVAPSVAGRSQVQLGGSSPP